MHDPVRQTGQWLKSVVQGYFNYYAVPGNLTSLGVFRDRVLALWWRTIRRRSQKRRISWTRILVLAQRWLPQPRALHPRQLTNPRGILWGKLTVLVLEGEGRDLAGQAALPDELSNSRILSKTTVGDCPFCKNAST